MRSVSVPGQGMLSQELARLYELDETAWLEETAQRIKQGNVHDLDYENLAEFLESMAKRDRREVRSRLVVMLTHLLKWFFQPSDRSTSWRTTIQAQRLELEELLQSKTLANYAEENLPDFYARAVHAAADETKKSTGDFPAECPYSLENILDPTFPPQEVLP